MDIRATIGPIYLCIATGCASVRWGLFSKAAMRVFGKFVIDLNLPAWLVTTTTSFFTLSAILWLMRHNAGRLGRAGVGPRRLV